MNSLSVTTKNNKRGYDALIRINRLTVSLMESERVSKLWKIRDSVPMNRESKETFYKNMKLIDENAEDYQEVYERLLKI